MVLLTKRVEEHQQQVLHDHGHGKQISAMPNDGIEEVRRGKDLRSIYGCNG